MTEPSNTARSGRWALRVYRRGVPAMIGTGVPSFQLNEINDLEGSL